MPHQRWRFKCCGEFSSGGPFCPRCGAEGEFLGWGLGMHELMGRFTRITGLPALGPGRTTPEAKAIIARITKCPACRGNGVINHPTRSDLWEYCSHCEGNGAALDGKFIGHPIPGPPPPPFTPPPEGIDQVDVSTAEPAEELSVERELVFQERFGGKGVLIGRKVWERLSSIDRAIRSASTWREFQASTPEGEFESMPMWCVNGGDHGYRESGRLLFVPADVADYFLDDQEMVIDAEDPFHPEQILGFSDGDYPPWIDAITETSLPEVLLEAFGILAESRISGSWTEFLVEDLDAMKRVLEVAGFEVVAEVDLQGRPLESDQGGSRSTD